MPRKVNLTWRVRYWKWIKPMDVFHVYLCLLFKAKSGITIENNILIERGQALVTYRELIEKTKIPQQDIRDCLEILIDNHEIKVKSMGVYGLITILNFEAFDIEKDFWFDFPIN